METAKVLDDQVRRQKVENTFAVLEKWDHPSLLQARGFTRKLKLQHSTLSPDRLNEKIDAEEDLAQSIVLVFNYFENVRVSVETDRVDANLLSDMLGGVYQDIYERFRPWVNKQEPQYLSLIHI